MRISPILFATFSLLCATANASPEGVLPTLEKGLEEARRSGQAVVYITKWKKGI